MNAQCDESEDSGKFIMVDTRDEALLAQHSIFFDDNVERTHAHIVDIRDAASGETVRFEKARGLYLVRAEPVRSILDRDYFIDAVRACEARRDAGCGAGHDTVEGRA